MAESSFPADGHLVIFKVERTMTLRTEAPPWNGRGLTGFYTRTILNGKDIEHLSEKLN